MSSDSNQQSPDRPYASLPSNIPVNNLESSNPVKINRFTVITHKTADQPDAESAASAEPPPPTTNHWMENGQTDSEIYVTCGSEDTPSLDAYYGSEVSRTRNNSTFFLFA